MNLRSPMRTAASTDCLVETEVASERGRSRARSAHARGKSSSDPNPRFAIHPLRPGTGRAPLSCGSQIRPQLKVAADLKAASDHLLSGDSRIGWVHPICQLGFKCLVTLRRHCCSKES